MKLKVILTTVVLSTAIFAGCAKQAAPTPQASAPTAQPSAPVTQASAPSTTTGSTATTTSPSVAAKPDAVTSASIVDNADAFLKAISKNGTWLIATTKDITLDKEIVLEGEFKNGKKDKDGKDIIQRKLGPYTQDEKRNVTARFTITAPKLTITSPEASLQHGNFKGDIYVSVKNFQLIDAKVDGNVYFTSEEAKSTFKMDAKSSVTGKQELKK